MTDLAVLHRGSRSARTRSLAAATNRRLKARDLTAYRIPEQELLTTAMLVSVRKAAWALGALRATCVAVTTEARVAVGVQAMILNPGRRTTEQAVRGKHRIAGMRASRKRRAAQTHNASARRRAICIHAKRAAANYRQNPGAYHYLAGGKANLVYLTPTPRDWRSDCSQFVAAVYKAAGLPSPGDVSHEWVNTWAIDRKGQVTTHPKPGDLGLYGPKGNPHHVEVYIGEPGCMYLGHGSAPIDAVTPGLPDYYVTFPFLES